ncbi:hypothetical protein HQ529_02380 [Candidatus Woesearchaeota archaeon]|nr:hypothetical protein [Candidatus Woesearchaeota archaeon]
MNKNLDVGRGIKNLYEAIENCNKIEGLNFHVNNGINPVNSVYQFLQQNIPDISDIDLTERGLRKGLEHDLKAINGEETQKYTKRTLDVSARVLYNMAESKLDTEQTQQALETVLGIVGAFDSRNEQTGYMNTFSGLLKSDTKSKVMQQVITEGLPKLLEVSDDPMKLRCALNAILVACGTIQMRYYQSEISEDQIPDKINSELSEIFERYL